MWLKIYTHAHTHTYRYTRYTRRRFLGRRRSTRTSARGTRRASNRCDTYAPLSAGDAPRREALGRCSERRGRCAPRHRPCARTCRSGMASRLRRCPRGCIYVAARRKGTMEYIFFVDMHMRACVRVCMCVCVYMDRVWFGSQAFYGASAFNANIGAWNTASVTDLLGVCAAFGR